LCVSSEQGRFIGISKTEDAVDATKILKMSFHEATGL